MNQIARDEIMDDIIKRTHLYLSNMPHICNFFRNHIQPRNYLLVNYRNILLTKHSNTCESCHSIIDSDNLVLHHDPYISEYYKIFNTNYTFDDYFHLILNFHLDIDIVCQDCHKLIHLHNIFHPSLRVPRIKRPSLRLLMLKRRNPTISYKSIGEQCDMSIHRVRYLFRKSGYAGYMNTPLRSVSRHAVIDL